MYMYVKWFVNISNLPPRPKYWFNYDSLYFPHSADALFVYDGNGDSGSPFLGRFCGSGLPPMLESSSSLMTVRFVSDFQEQYDGFVLTYEVGK